MRHALAAVLIAGLPLAGGRGVSVQFRVYADTSVKLTDVVWTGKRFLYVENTTNEIYWAGPKGKRVRPFASLPDVVEETRCRLSPGSHGFAAGDIYCHSPDGKIYRLSGDGKAVGVFAAIPTPQGSDGALAFDTGGAFGYALLAATGRSGTEGVSGGSVYAIDSRGRVRHVGDYGGPGGVDSIAIAPSGFGTAAHKLLLAVDAGSHGIVQSMDSAGRTATLVALSDGPNPIVAIPPANPRGRRVEPPPSGLYVSDTTSGSVYFASDGALAAFRGRVIVGSELRGLFWIVRPRGSGFVAVPLETNLAGAFNLEGATYVR
jgi:hypothetical protein